MPTEFASIGVDKQTQGLLRKVASVKEVPIYQLVGEMARREWELCVSNLTQTTAGATA